MSYKNRFLAFSLVLILLGLAACEKGNSYYENFSAKEAKFDGTSLEFLEAQGNLYDSLLLVLDRVPDLRAKLKDPKAQITFFATSNTSFSNAIEAMNAVRKAGNRTPLYLEDIPQKLLDTLTYHYAFEGIYNTAAMQEYVEGKEIKAIDQYRMNLKYKVTSATGTVNGGQQQLVLSDMNNSIFIRYWQESVTSVVNIRTTNGMVHVLVPSHNFGFSKLAKLLNR